METNHQGRFSRKCAHLVQALSFVFALGLISIIACSQFAVANTESRALILTGDSQATPFPLMGQGSISIGPLSPSLFNQVHLFGDWGGAQSWLQNRGFFLSFAMNEELAGNVSGGRTRQEVFTGAVIGELDIDWRKFAGVTGLWTHILVQNGHGSSFSHSLGDYVTNPEEVYGARGNVVAHLTFLYADKTLWSDRLILSLGFIPTGSFFNFDYLACWFMNVDVCANIAPGKYLNGGHDWPSGNMGGVLRYRPTERTYIMAGMFAVSHHTYSAGISGWSMLQSGLGKTSTQFELGWDPAFGKSALLGHYKLGFWYDNSHYPNLYEDQYGNSYQASGLAPRQVAGMWSSWFMFDQMLLRNGPGLADGLITIGGVAYSQGNVSAMRDHEWIGLLDSGSDWGRPHDEIGIMFQHFDMSKTVRLQEESSVALHRAFLASQWGTPYGIQSWEQAYEAFYSIYIAEATNFQLDFQYLQHPDATTTFKNAVIFGAQITSNF